MLHTVIRQNFDNFFFQIKNLTHQKINIQNLENQNNRKDKEIFPDFADMIKLCLFECSCTGCVVQTKS